MSAVLGALGVVGDRMIDNKRMGNGISVFVAFLWGLFIMVSL